MAVYKGLFVCDVDGTILPHGQREIAPSFFSLVREATERGFLFCISSGRFHMALIPLFQPIADLVVFSASNGCRILHHGKDLIPLHSINHADVLAIIDQLLENNSVPLLSGEHSILLPDTDMEVQSQKGFLLKEALKAFKTPKDIDERILQITGVCVTNKLEILAAIRASWAHKYHVVTTGKELFDICPTSKGESLTEIRTYFDIPVKRTFAFGDDENDLPMLHSAGGGYLMASAVGRISKTEGLNLCHDLETTIRRLMDLS